MKLFITLFGLFDNAKAMVLRSSEYLILVTARINPRNEFIKALNLIIVL